MQESWTDKFTKSFFWFGYIVFLGASIPHIATYFHHFDAPATGAQEVFNWGIAILLAIVIDVSDVLVSIAVMKAQAAGAQKRETFGFWLFIVLIMALSWFFNWQYNVVFGTHEFASVDQISFGFFTVGQINPVVGSAFQLLLLVYTGMAHKFSHKPVVKTAAELKAEADELEAKQEHLARIASIKKAQNEQSIKGFFSKVKTFTDEARKTVPIGQSGVDDLDKTVEYLTQNPQATDEQLAVYLGKKRPASARFWRLKAQILMQEHAQKTEVSAEPVDEKSGSQDGTFVAPLAEGEMEEDRLEDDGEDGSQDGRITDPEMEAVNVVQFPGNGTTPTAKNTQPLPQSRKFSRRKPLTVAEAAAELGCTERRVRELRANGTLQTADEAKKLITASSVKAYKASPQRKQKTLSN